MFLCSTCASLAVVLISGVTLPTHIKHLGNVDPNTAGLFELLNTLVLMFCFVMAALLFSFTTYHVSLICSGESSACCLT
jgi:palmitoyltransferase ZDHHC9/14/18/palmitoyltransferase